MSTATEWEARLAAVEALVTAPFVIVLIAGALAACLLSFRK